MAFKDFITGAIGSFMEKGAKIADEFTFSKEERAQYDLQQAALANKLTIDLMDAANEQERMFNERTIALEGTAQDLRVVPYVGPLIILLRGAFRPLFSYLVGWFDFVYLTSVGREWTETQEKLLLTVNVLVLVFYFGERAIKNLLPLLTNLLVAKNGKA